MMGMCWRYLIGCFVLLGCLDKLSISWNQTVTAPPPTDFKPETKKPLISIIAE